MPSGIWPVATEATIVLVAVSILDIPLEVVT